MFLGKRGFFPKLKLALFLDGCFWHSCPTHGTRPASNRAFWNKKLQRNRTRDRKSPPPPPRPRLARRPRLGTRPKAARLPALTKRLRRLLNKYGLVSLL
jgi:hypothetical protein